jgi:hypothetical protein
MSCQRARISHHSMLRRVLHMPAPRVVFEIAAVNLILCQRERTQGGSVSDKLVGHRRETLSAGRGPTRGKGEERPLVGDTRCEDDGITVSLDTRQAWLVDDAVASSARRLFVDQRLSAERMTAEPRPSSAFVLGGKTRPSFGRWFIQVIFRRRASTSSLTTAVSTAAAPTLSIEPVLRLLK